MHTLKLILCWSIFWFDYTQSFWIWVYQHGTSWLSNICLLFFAKTLQICQIAMASPVYSPLQIIPQIFNRIQVWALAGPFQNFSLFLVKPFFCWFGCMLWVVVVLKDSNTWHMNFLFSFLAEAWSFCANIDCYLEQFISVFLATLLYIGQTYEEYGRLLSHILHSQYFTEIPAAPLMLL